MIMNTDKQTASEKTLIIANPMFDKVLKKLLSDERVVKFIISAMLKRQVTSIEILSRRSTAYKRNTAKSLEKAATFSMDILATFQYEEGKPKRRLIQIRKFWKQLSTMEVFPRYYNDDADVTSPITRIYILGKDLDDIDCPCVASIHEYTDMTTKEALYPDSEFTNTLFRDTIAIQAGRITEMPYDESLNKVVSIFEQAYFVKPDSIVTKEYRYQPDDEDIKRIIDILHKIAVNPDELKQVEIEEENMRSHIIGQSE
jgi:hypothetical protein